MKARRTMEHQPLIQEVISQISQQLEFTPKILDITKVRVITRFPLLITDGLVLRLLTHYWRRDILSG
jgi:hypothetical protein